MSKRRRKATVTSEPTVPRPIQLHDTVEFILRHAQDSTDNDWLAVIRDALDQAEQTVQTNKVWNKVQKAVRSTGYYVDFTNTVPVDGLCHGTLWLNVCARKTVDWNTSGKIHYTYAAMQPTCAADLQLKLKRQPVNESALLSSPNRALLEQTGADAYLSAFRTQARVRIVFRPCSVLPQAPFEGRILTSSEYLGTIQVSRLCMRTDGMNLLDDFPVSLGTLEQLKFHILSPA